MASASCSSAPRGYQLLLEGTVTVTWNGDMKFSILRIQISFVIAIAAVSCGIAICTVLLISEKGSQFCVKLCHRRSPFLHACLVWRLTLYRKSVPFSIFEELTFTQHISHYHMLCLTSLSSYFIYSHPFSFKFPVHNP